LKTKKNLIIQKITGLTKEQLFLTSPLTPLLKGEGDLFKYNEYMKRLEA
jgi:hypothetical protein